MLKVSFLQKYLFFICVSISILAVVFMLQSLNFSILYKSKVRQEIKQKTQKNSMECPKEGDPITYISSEFLEENFHKCLMGPFRNNIFNLSTTITVEEEGNLSVLLKFSELSRALNIQTIIIEPFLIYCMLSKSLKTKLLKKNFTINMPNDFLITVAIFQRYIDCIETEEALAIIRKHGFEIEFMKRSKPKWMNCPTCNDDLITTHIFFRYKEWTLHGVVFFQRKNYLWHSALVYEEMLYEPTVTSYYFLNSDGAFENYTAGSLGQEKEYLMDISIPNNPGHFLFQIESSKFLECNMTIVENFKKLKDTKHPSNHTQFSGSEFNTRLLKSLRELKTQLDPLFLRFWIWSGTMLGWYRECGVIPFTEDVDFGAWASDVDDLDGLVKIFTGNSSLRISERMGVVGEGLEFNLNCDGLRVDLFFLYPESNGTWYAGHRTTRHFYFKYHHPHFTLCSAELLDERVLVPCNTEHVIASEYGPNWMRPVSHWEYDISIYNRGPNIYWNRTMWRKVYVKY